MQYYFGIEYPIIVKKYEDNTHGASVPLLNIYADREHDIGYGDTAEEAIENLIPILSIIADAHLSTMESMSLHRESPKIPPVIHLVSRENDTITNECSITKINLSNN